MVEHAGVIVTDGRVLLGSEVEAEAHLTVVPREVRVEEQTLRSDERINVLRSLTREAHARRHPVQVLPPQRELFLRSYQALSERHRHVVSVHYLEAFDGAAREARICRQLMYPVQQIDVYEAKALEGGLQFLLKTAATLAQEGATTTQLIALLRYLETHMLTLLITPGMVRPDRWAVVTGAQRLRSVLPSTETLWHFDPKQQKLVVLAQSQDIHLQLGQLVQARWGQHEYAPLVRYRGWTTARLTELCASFAAAGLTEPARLEPVTATFLPCLPPTFVEVVLMPRAAELERLRGLVQDPIWWKGAA